MRERTERLAYQLWQEAGSPEGQADRFWREAEGLIAAERPVAPPPVVAAPIAAPPVAAPQAPTGWREALARYAAAWWAHPAKPADR